MAYLYAGTSFAWLSSPFLVSISARLEQYINSVLRSTISYLTLEQVSFLTFGVYVLSSEENVLNAQIAFVSVSLFNIIKTPMKMLPISIIAIIQVKSSMNVHLDLVIAPGSTTTCLLSDPHSRETYRRIFELRGTGSECRHARTRM